MNSKSNLLAAAAFMTALTTAPEAEAANPFLKSLVDEKEHVQDTTRANLLKALAQEDLHPKFDLPTYTINNDSLACDDLDHALIEKVTYAYTVYGPAILWHVKLRPPQAHVEAGKSSYRTARLIQILPEGPLHTWLQKEAHSTAASSSSPKITGIEPMSTPPQFPKEILEALRSEIYNDIYNDHSTHVVDVLMHANTLKFGKVNARITDMRPLHMIHYYTTLTPQDSNNTIGYYDPKCFEKTSLEDKNFGGWE